MVHPTKQTKGEIVSQKNGYISNQWGVTDEDTPKKTLSEIGLTRNESSAFQSMQDGFLLQ